MSTVLSKEDAYQIAIVQKEARQEEFRKSQEAITDLIDDVDEPVRRCVAFLNLLAVETIWSCCGFDYQGQPKHKTHEYGNVYFRCVATPEAYQVAINVLNYKPDLISVEKNPWYVMMYANGPIAEIQFKYAGHVDWNNPNSWQYPGSPHFHEQRVVAIDILERALLTMTEQMKDEVILKDCNVTMKRKHTAWDYAPKNPWHIKKVDYVSA